MEKCERTQDAWLRGVQDEFRFGKLSVETHAFLHGHPTMQPGSYVKGEVRCSSKKCTNISSLAAAQSNLSALKRAEFATKTLGLECAACKKERATRQLVATDGNDPRFQSDKFACAPAVFANDDIKYDVNKLCAQAFAAKRNTGVMYCPAKDFPSQEALRVRSDLPAQKMHWLKRHDRESGDLYGILPLIKGMPVAMTDHIDRSVDKTDLARARGIRALLGTRR